MPGKASSGSGSRSGVGRIRDSLVRDRMRSSVSRSSSMPPISVCVKGPCGEFVAEVRIVDQRGDCPAGARTVAANGVGRKRQRRRHARRTELRRGLAIVEPSNCRSGNVASGERKASAEIMSAYRSTMSVAVSAERSSDLAGRNRSRAAQGGRAEDERNAVIGMSSSS